MFVITCERITKLKMGVPLAIFRVSFDFGIFLGYDFASEGFLSQLSSIKQRRLANYVVLDSVS